MQVSDKESNDFSQLTDFTWYDDLYQHQFLTGIDFADLGAMQFMPTDEPTGKADRQSAEHSVGMPGTPGENANEPHELDLLLNGNPGATGQADIDFDFLAFQATGAEMGVKPSAEDTLQQRVIDLEKAVW